MLVLEEGNLVLFAKCCRLLFEYVGDRHRSVSQGEVWRKVWLVV